jgi:RNA polymerase sigma-70 factor, ECF subfamily
MSLHSVTPSGARTIQPTIGPAPMPEQDPRSLPAAGDRAAFEAMFRQQREDLYRFLYAQLRSPEDAEDAVMLTFHKAWQARSSFRGESSVRTWLHRIGFRVVVDMVRCRGRRPTEAALAEEYPRAQGVLPEELLDPAETVLEEERVTELRRAVHCAIDQLPAPQRQLLALYYFEERPYDEISSLTGIPYTKIRGRLYRIRQLLRRDLMKRRSWQPEF